MSLCGYCNRPYNDPLVYDGEIHHHDNLKKDDIGIKKAAQKYNSKISTADYKKLFETEPTKPKKVHQYDKKVDYWAICAEPGWKAFEHEGETYYVLPMPPSANEYWRSITIKGKARTVLSAKAKSYKEALADLVKRLKMPMFTGDVSLTVWVYRNQASGDVGNRFKVLEDALNGVAYADDKQIQQQHAYRYDDRGKGRVVILIKEVTGRVKEDKPIDFGR